MKIFEDLPPGQINLVRKVIYFSVLLVDGLILVSLIFYGAAAAKTLKGIWSEETFQISSAGEGKVFAKPDVAKITATVLTENVLLLDAQKENSDLSNKVVDSLKKNNVAEKDIQTLNYNIYPQYSYPAPCYPPSPCPVETNSPKIIGYQVRTTFEVTVRDITKSGNILEGGIRVGVNEISNVELTVGDPKKFREEARQLAVEDARNKAQAIASSLGKSLGRMVAYSGSDSVPQSIPLGLGGGAADKGVALPSIQPGENEVVSAVVISYEIKYDDAASFVLTLEPVCHGRGRKFFDLLFIRSAGKIRCFFC